MDAGFRQTAPPAQGNAAHPGKYRRAVRGHRSRGSSLILDTNALCAFADGESGVGEVLRRQARAAIPVIVPGEFRCGIARSRHRSIYEAWLRSELHGFDDLALIDETAASYAELRVTLRRLGRPIPANDAWIAALGIQHRLPILSRDPHFDVVPGLERRSW